MTEASGKQVETELQPILEVHASSSTRAERVSTALRNLSQNSLFRSAMRNLALIALWYLLGTSLTLWNKWLVAKNRTGFFGKGPFPAPFLLSSLQFFAQHLTARTVIALGLSQRKAQQGDWKHYFKTVVPNGVATGLDIGFSNYSLVFITISFYVMCKSTTPLFLLVFAIAWGVEKASWSLAGVVAVIASGLLLLVAGETKFNLVGFLLVMTAAMLAGLRWTITQVLLHGHKTHGASSPTEVIFELTPVMGITVLLLSLGHERLWSTLPGSPYFDSLGSVLVTLLIVVTGGLIAFSMVWSEFMLIKCTSALTFMVAGTFKEIITVLAGVVLDGDRFTAINAVGLGVLILGVVLFNMQKYYKLKRGELQPATRDPRDTEGHKLTTANEVEVTPLHEGGGGTPLGGGAAGSGNGALSWPHERRVFLLDEGEGEGEEEEEALLPLPGSALGISSASSGWAAGGGSLTHSPRSPRHSGTHPNPAPQHHQQQRPGSATHAGGGSGPGSPAPEALQRRESV